MTQTGVMKVIIESPFAGDKERNIKYARQCLLDSLMRGESPIAFHLLYTQVLNDDIEQDRVKGIMRSFEWQRSADLIAFYTDYGMSKGMEMAEENSKNKMVYRKIL